MARNWSYVGEASVLREAAWKVIKEWEKPGLYNQKELLNSLFALKDVLIKSRDIRNGK